MSLCIALLFFMSTSAGAESLTSFLSQKTNEVWNWESCQKASLEENRNLSKTFNYCVQSSKQGRLRPSADAISEKIFFETAAQSQLKSYDCLIKQSDQILRPTSPTADFSRIALAQTFSKNIEILRKIKKELDPIEDELAEMEISQTSSAMGETIIVNSIDERRRKALKNRQRELLAAKNAVFESQWQGKSNIVQQRILGEVSKKNFDPVKFENEFLDSAGSGSLNAIILKLKTDTSFEKETLLSKAQTKLPIENFDLSDQDKIRLYRDRNWLTSINIQDKQEQTSLASLSCRIEGRYGEGRERFYTTVEVGGSVALFLVPGGLYLAAGRGLLALRTTKVLSLIAASGIAVGTLASAYEHKCPLSDLKSSRKTSCSLPSNGFVEDLEEDSCALNVALAALNTPLPEFKAAIGIGAIAVKSIEKADKLERAKDYLAVSKDVRPSSVTKLDEPKIGWLDKARKLQDEKKLGKSVFEPEVEARVSTNFEGQHFSNGIMVTGGSHYPLKVVQNNLGLTDQVLSTLPKDAKILSVGEGASDLTPSLRQKFSNTKALDIWYDQKNLPTDLEKYVAENKSNLLTGSSTKIPMPDKSMDMVVSHQLINNLPSEAVGKSLDEMTRVLKPGGQARIAYCCMRIDDAIAELKLKYGREITVTIEGWQSNWYYRMRNISLEGQRLIIRRNP